MDSEILSASATNPETWIEELSTLVESDERRALLERNASANTTEVSQQLYDEALRLMRIDLERAERVAEALLWATDHLAIDKTRGQALRMSAHILYLRGHYEAAVVGYSAAQNTFEQLGDEVETARTISAAIHTLIYLGHSSQALTLAERARAIFVKHGDELRLARLDVNVGNLFYRQDRFAEALEMYERGCDVLRSQGDAQDVAIVLRNMAVCELGLSHFDRALEIYRDGREFTAKHDLPLLLAEADYNIAYLYFLRGEYSQAVELYEAARALCGSAGDVYHRSLCDLDQSEIYLEVNLVHEADVLAADAFAGFQQLGMRYESAKALTFRALAASRIGHQDVALEWLNSARRMFVLERNRLWPAVIDFDRAVILFERGSIGEARRLCGRALQRFHDERMNSKAAVCELLLARMEQSENRFSEAKSRCLAALDLIREVQAPAVNFQAQLLFGQVLESSGDKQEAFAAYTRAHRQLETLRSQVQIDDIKISLLKDKLSVYEGLVTLCLEEGDESKAFDFLERAKSRSLAESIAARVHTLRPKTEAAGLLGIELEAIGDKLASLRHRQRQEESGGKTSSETISRLAGESLACEREFGRVASRVAEQDQQLALLLTPGSVSLGEIQGALADDSLVLEYYEARGNIYACVVSRDALRVVPITTVAEVHRHFNLLQFQLSKFGLGADYMSIFAEQMQRATEAHLRSLYLALIAPIRDSLRAGHLVIVPHGILHRVPFHALMDGERHLIDEYSISYAPSASINHLCSLAGAAPTQDSLVLGVPDSIAPDIFGEAKAVAGILPRTTLFLGQEATGERLFQYASSSRVIHIATHGRFRDSPILSSVRLADTNISLFDLYQLRLDAELVTLSGCGTGLNMVVGGDELLGLVRGLLYAGARSVLASLWDVNDASTSAFMKSFYQRWAETGNRGVAMQKAIQELRATHPHPYYWAPFALIGKHT